MYLKLNVYECPACSARLLAPRALNGAGCDKECRNILSNMLLASFRSNVVVIVKFVRRMTQLLKADLKKYIKKNK